MAITYLSRFAVQQNQTTMKPDKLTLKTPGAQFAALSELKDRFLLLPMNPLAGDCNGPPAMGSETRLARSPQTA